MHERECTGRCVSVVAKLRREFPFDVILAAWAYRTRSPQRVCPDFDCPLITRVMGSDINEIALMPHYESDSVGAESYAYHPGGKQRLTRAVGRNGHSAPRRFLMRHNGVNGNSLPCRIDRKYAGMGLHRIAPSSVMLVTLSGKRV